MFPFLAYFEVLLLPPKWRDLLPFCAEEGRDKAVVAFLEPPVLLQTSDSSQVSHDLNPFHHMTLTCYQRAIEAQSLGLGSGSKTLLKTNLISGRVKINAKLSLW